MANGKHWTVETPTTTQANGSSDTNIHQKAFPNSPFYNGELTDEVVREQFVELVQEGEVVDNPLVPNYNRDFGENGAPNMDEVETGGGGLPGSPYAPNIASPGVEGSHNPADIPSAGVEATEEARGQGSPFPGDGLTSPHNSSKVIDDQTVRLGSLSFGTSTPGNA